MTAALDVLVPTSGRPGALAVTLTALACSTVRDLRVVVSDQSEGAPSYDDPVVRAVLRVLEHHGSVVELHRHLPRRGMAEHRDFLLSLGTADRVLFLDDDVLLEPTAVATLLDALDATGGGFVAMAMQGLSHVGDERPHEQVAYEEWAGPVEPERVRKDVPAWERWRLHNAANLVHLDRRLGPHPPPTPPGRRCSTPAGSPSGPTCRPPPPARTSSRSCGCWSAPAAPACCRRAPGTSSCRRRSATGGPTRTPSSWRAAQQARDGTAGRCEAAGPPPLGGTP